MTNRAFHVVVAMLWFSTMGWLVVSKVLPSLRRGDPPSYRAPVDEESIVVWRLNWNDRPMGWAATRTIPGDAGVREVHSRVVLADLPLEQIAPAWLGALVREQVGNIDMDARSRLEIDPLGNLSSFRTSVRLSEIEGAIKMIGRVEESTLKLTVSAGSFTYRTEKFLPQNSLVFNELSPRALLVGLHVGQNWTVPVYSPFRPPNDPLEILHASVEYEDFLEWGGRAIPTNVVVYRNDPGAGVAAGARPRGRLWVRGDGRVLQQEVEVINSTMRFVRMPADEAAPFEKRLDADWLATIDWDLAATEESPSP
jgi:hypothetical protein